MAMAGRMIGGNSMAVCQIRGERHEQESQYHEQRERDHERELGSLPLMLVGEFVTSGGLALEDDCHTDLAYARERVAAASGVVMGGMAVMKTLVNITASIRYTTCGERTIPNQTALIKVSLSGA